MEKIEKDNTLENTKNENLEKTIEMEPISNEEYLEDTITDFNFDFNE